MRKIRSAIALGATALTAVGLAGAPLGFAQVDTTGNVTTLVDSVKDNVGQTEIVTGSKADISDGRHAARIAATLVNQNYVEATQDDFEVSGADVTDATATVEKTGDAVAEISGNNYPIEYEPDALSSDVYESTGGNNKVITQTQLPDVLSKEDLEDVKVGGNEVDYTFKEEIEIDTGSNSLVQYHEQEDPDGHGLYWGTDDNAYDDDAIIWRFRTDEAGQGLIMDKGNYTGNNELPHFHFLGEEYVLDLDAVDDGEVVLFPGSGSGSIYVDESMEHEDWTVTLNSVDTDSDTAVGGTFIVEKDGESTTINIDDDTGEEVTLGGDTLSIYLDETQMTFSGDKGARADILLGTGELDLTDDNGDGDPFPLDENWEIKDDGDWIENDYLNKIELKYGNDDATEYLETGEFNAEVPNSDGDTGGLAVGESVMGPGTSGTNFEIKFSGWGEVGSTNPTTPVEITLDEDIGEVTWMDKAGELNTFDPSDDDDVLFGSGGTISTLEEDQMTVSNNKVLFFNDAEKLDNGLYNLEFQIHGEGGDSVTVGPINATDGLGSGTADLAKDYGGDGLNCEVDYDATASPQVAWIGHDGAAGCDLDESDIAIGGQKFDSYPKLDLSNIEGVDVDADANSTIDDDTDAYAVPFVTIDQDDSDAEDIAVYYDNSTSNDGQEIYVDEDADITPDDLSSATKVVDYSQSDVEEPDEYHVTGWGTEVDTSNKKDSSFVIPEAQRKTLLEVKGISEEGEAAGQTVSEGDTFGDWELTSIDVGGTDATVENAGDFYRAKSTLTTPENLVTADDAAAATYQIVVGGPFVNSVAEGMEGADDLATEGDSVLSADGDKLLVAGYSATDTGEAADELISLLKA